jgi:hypothetical protein
MRFVILLTTDTPGPPPPPLMKALMELGQEAGRSGVLVDNARLAPSAAGARVTLSGGEIGVSDGPVTDIREFVSYAVYEVASREEAVEWASRFLALYRDLWPDWQGAAEIRQVLPPPTAPPTA